MQIQPHAFRPADLVGGHVALDLVNTVTARDADPIDWLESYERALEWAALTEHFDAGTLALLGRLNAAEPCAGALALQRLRELREITRDVLAAAVRHEPTPVETLAGFEAFWKDAVAHTRVTLSDRRGLLELDVESSRLEYIRHELALRAFELLQTLPLDRTRICAGANCGWLFIDRSKGGRRRWCDMATCGNAAKTRRHQQRKRAAIER